MRASLKEAVRRKTFLIMGIITVLYLAFWAVMLYFYNRQVVTVSVPGATAMADRLISQMGLQFSSMLVALLTIMLAAGTVSSEIETGVIHAVLSRPISREAYLSGKFVGLMIISCAYATVLYGFLLGIAAAFGLQTIIGISFGMAIGGWAVFIAMPIALLCLTIYGSLSMKTVPNGILMIFIYILGNIGGMVEQVGNMISSSSVTGAGIFLSLVSPFHTLYITAENILLPISSGLAGALESVGGGLSGSGAPPSVWMYVYIVVYVCAFAALGMRKFAKKDIA